MGDISDGWEEQALKSLARVEKIDKKVEKGQQLTKKEFLVYYGYEPYFGVWDTPTVVDHLEQHWSKTDIIHYLLKECIPKRRGILIDKVHNEKRRLKHEYH